MKQLFLLGILFVSVTLTGCAGTNPRANSYCVDRGRDLADILTLTVGKGLGAKARIGPFVLSPLLVEREVAGLRGGTLFVEYPSPARGLPWMPDDMGFLLANGSRFASDRNVQWSFESSLETVRLRGKDYQSATLALTSGFWSFLSSLPISIPEADDGPYPSYYWTQIEMLAGVGGTIRLGFNPGELLDFILGWVAIDIFNDDLKGVRPRRETREEHDERLHREWRDKCLEVERKRLKASQTNKVNTSLSPTHGGM